LLNLQHQVQLEDSWCLPACASIVCSYWEQPIYQGDLARWFGTSSIGTPAKNITALTKFGFEVTVKDGSLELLRDLLLNNVPAILFVRTSDLPYWQVDTAHAIVIAGLDVDTVYIFDPAFEDTPKSVPIEEMMLAWSYFDYTLAIIKHNQQ